MNRKGGLTDLFLFMIIAFILLLFSGVFLYISNEATDEIRENLKTMNLKGDGNQNATEVLNDTMGSAQTSFDALYWISILLIFGMIFSIFIGSYLVTTKPIFFIPYTFIVIIAVIVSVPISNGYETLRENATLSSTFANFVGSNWIMSNLAMIIAVVGITGGIIMFARMSKGQESAYYGY